jgi:hypothetical protein
MPLSASEPWDKFLDSEKRFERNVTEREVVLNCLHMLLGLKTDFFKSTHEYVPVVQTSFVESLFCSHISPRALVSVLKNIARYAFFVNALRMNVRESRLKNELIDVAFSDWGRRILGNIDKWLRSELPNGELTLLDLFVRLKGLVYECNLINNVRSAMDSDKEDDFRNLCTTIFASDPYCTLDSIKSILSMKSLSPEKHIQRDSLIESSHEVQTDESPESPDRPPALDLPSKTLFVCYVNENRIVSY